MKSCGGYGGKQIAVISPEFCAPENVHLRIVKKRFAVTHGNFVVTDEHDNTMFKVKDKLLSLHDRHLILNPDGIPIPYRHIDKKSKSTLVLILFQKISARKRWQVFRGESSRATDLIFRVRKSSVLQFKTELDVFLSGNEEERLWDFKVVGSWLERSCDIYDKNSSPIAKMLKKHSLGSIVLGKDTFEVTVSPRVDHVFIIALVVIFYEINKDEDV
ncbi:hypothetical protein ACS0TY_008832 [Phlomoides rotata]